MSALESEVIKKFYQLDKEAQKRVRELITQGTDLTDQAHGLEFDYDEWFRDVEALREQIRASHGNKLPTMDVVGILRDIRDGEDE